MKEWQGQDDVAEMEEVAPLAGVIPIAVLLHQTQGLTLGPLTQNDHVAESRDREALSVAF